MLSGIYKITNLENGKIYLGKSVNTNKRIKAHKTYLKHNNHYNIYLQRAYNKYPDMFIFETILYCDESLLNQYEQDLIWLSESYKPEVGYNLTLGGDGGERANEETRRKMSLALLGNQRTKGMKMKNTRSDEFRKKMSLLKLGKKRGPNKKKEVS